MKDNKALKLSETVKSSKEVANSLESENFSVIDDEMLHELSSTSLSKMLSKTDSQALIVVKKQSIDINKVLKSSIIDLIETEVSATSFINKKLFYMIKIKTKLRLIIL